MARGRASGEVCGTAADSWGDGIGGSVWFIGDWSKPCRFCPRFWSICACLSYWRQLTTMDLQLFLLWFVLKLSWVWVRLGCCWRVGILLAHICQLPSIFNCSLPPSGRAENSFMWFLLLFSRVQRCMNSYYQTGDKLYTWTERSRMMLSQSIEEMHMWT